MEHATPFVPSIEAQPGTVGAAVSIPGISIPDENYALDPGFRDAFQQNVVPLVWYTRLYRQNLEAEWLDILCMEQMVHDSNRSYLGRSKAYLPLWARIHQTTVSALSRGLFPSDDYMDVADATDTNPEASKPTKRYLQWEFEQNGRVRSRIKPFLKQVVSYGTSPLKFWYERQEQPVKQGRRMRLADVLRKAMTVQTQWTPGKDGEGLRVSPRPIFYWYLYPSTAQSLEEATLVFEDIDTPKMTIQRKQERGVWPKDDRVFAASPIQIPGHITSQYVLKNRLAGDDSIHQGSTSDVAQMLTLTEGYTYAVLPDRAYMPGETKGEPVPVVFVLAQDFVVSVRRNPFWHQRPPYVVGRMNWMPGLFYGYGSGKMVLGLQQLANDFANQTNDVGQYCLNPISKVNPALMAGPLRPLKPGVTWYMTDIENGAKFERPPAELIDYGTTMIQFYISLGMDLGGAPPITQGIGGGKAGKTATQAQILQGNVASGFQDIVEDLEGDVMIPLMYGTWMNGQQYAPDELLLMVAGENIRVTPEMLAINPVFRWMASSQAVNRAQRAQQAIGLIQAVAPILPYLAQTGFIVNFPALIKRIYVDGFGFRGFEEFITRAQAAGPAGAPVPPEAMPGIQAEQEDRVRSALEQIQNQMGGEAAPMAPGEGESFMDVRANADQMAGMMGGGQG